MFSLFILILWSFTKFISKFICLYIINVIIFLKRFQLSNPKNNPIKSDLKSFSRMGLKHILFKHFISSYAENIHHLGRYRVSNMSLSGLQMTLHRRNGPYYPPFDYSPHTKRSSDNNLKVTICINKNTNKNAKKSHLH